MLGNGLLTRGHGGLYFSNDGTVTTIMGTVGDYIRIGDAGTTAHSLASEDDLMVTGKLEVKGQTYLDSGILMKNTIYMQEVAAALGDIGAYGQIWVKNTTPCELWFTDDAGTDKELAMKHGAEADLTIATGAVAVTQTYHSIIVEGGTGTANDQLDTATGGSEGDILILKPNTSGGSDTVTVADGVGADAFILAGGANFAMDHIDDRLMLIHNGTEWVEISRSSNT